MRMYHSKNNKMKYKKTVSVKATNKISELSLFPSYLIQYLIAQF